MKTKTEPFILLDKLVDLLCERRALAPLRILLQAYPMNSGLSDEWHELRSAIRSLRALSDGILTEHEATLASDALTLVEDRLEAAGWKLGQSSSR